MKKKTMFLTILAAGLVCSSVHGQENAGDDKWEFSITPYFWFAGIDGDVEVRGNKVDVDVGFDDLWDALDFGGSFHFEAQKGQWGMFVDPMYLSLSTDKDLKPATAKLEMDIWAVELGGFYRVGEWERGGESGRPMTLDLLGGGRYWDVDQEVRIGGLSRKSDSDWIDPFIGARFLMEINDWLTFRIRGDIGGFAISSSASELTWNVFAGPVIKISDKVRIIAGYRVLDLEKEKGSDTEADLTFSGPQLGVHIRF